MIFGFQTRIVENTKNNRFLFIRGKNEYYQISSNKQEAQIKLLQNNILNALTAGMILRLFFNLEYYLCIIAALIIYSVYLFLFNTKLLPSFDQAAAKNIKIKKKPTSNSTAPLVQGIGFIIIAAGLVYCVLTNQAGDPSMKIMVYAVIVIAVFLGTKQVLNSLANGRL